MRNNKIILVSLIIIIVFIVGVVLRLAKPVIFPFFLAIFLSFILSPLLDFLTRLKVPKAISIIFILIIAFFVIYLLGSLFYSTGKAFAREFPKYGQKVSSVVTTIQDKINRQDWGFIDWIGQFDLTKVSSFIFSSLGTFLSFLLNLFLIFVFLIFILAGRGKTKEKILKSFEVDRSRKILNVFENIDKQIQRYLAIKTVVSFLTGFIVTFILMAFGVDFAIIFGFFAFILNYIPTIGSIIATAFPVIIACFQFETLWPAFWILIILISIQQIMGNFVEPRFMGRGLNLSPLVVLFSLFFWGWLWGIIGMILAVPIAAIIKIICDNIPSLKFVGIFMSRD